MERVEKEKEIEEFPDLNDIEMEKAPNSPIAVLARESIGKVAFCENSRLFRMFRCELWKPTTHSSVLL